MHHTIIGVVQVLIVHIIKCTYQADFIVNLKLLSISIYMSAETDVFLHGHKYCYKLEWTYIMVRSDLHFVPVTRLLSKLMILKQIILILQC